MAAIVIHVVKPGETIYSLGREYDLDPADIAEDNGLNKEDRLVNGQAIILAQEDEKLGSIKINGYALSTIDENIMRQVLPKLTYFSMFSFQATEDGGITPIYGDKFNDPVIGEQCVPMMVLTNIGGYGDYNGSLANQLLNDPAAVQRLVENTKTLLNKGNLRGVNIDFRYLYFQDKIPFNHFIGKMADMCRENNFIIRTSLVPKTFRTSPQEAYYQGHDYKYHGETVDSVCLMTYEWGNTFSPPMAAAPIGNVEAVVQYAVSNIEPQKIFLGIPNFGYDWVLPYTGSSSARKIGNDDAIRLAAMYNAVICYDERQQSPYFHYYDDFCQDHIVWFDDARSIRAKIDLVKRYNLVGICLWTVDRSCPQNWQVIHSLYDVEKERLF